MIDLSILVCGVHTRYNTFLPKIQKQLFEQYEDLSDVDKSRVEILVITDNKKMMLGHKRNIMVDIAQGKYIQFTDDDDRVSDDFLSSLLEATKSDADCISFQAEVSLNGGEPKICYYSIDNKKDYNTADSYYRIPNHICCVKKKVSLKSSFPNIKYGEDSAYSKILIPNIKTEFKIDKVLYYYDYDDRTSETQDQIEHVARVRSQTPLVDVVILSNAKTRDHYKLTTQAVNTCISGANGLPVNITVLEQRANTSYKNATTIHKPEKFHYNKFANFGAKRGTAEWILFANNDLVFSDGWLHNLLAANHSLVSPKSPRDPRQRDVVENEIGETNGRNLSGWCFMMERSLYEKIEGLDECVDFWCSDDVVIEQSKALGIKPMLVPSSIVNHLGSKTLVTEHSNDGALTWKNVKIFNHKYGKHKFEDNPSYKRWLETHS